MRHSADARLPPYRIPSRDNRALRVAPPFPFEGMTARVFPLRAHLDSLRQFCDSYLNIIPPELGRFRPAAPYVFLQILNYGRMAVQAENLGWFAQREVVFNVPVEWYRRIRGQWVFQDWATVSPFIFVDHEFSMTMGRTVYGWPKAIARLQATESAWMEDPAAPLTQATLRTDVFPELYRKRRLKEETFLEIDVGEAPRNLQLPFDPRTPFAPWSIAANLAHSFTGLARDYAGFLEALGVLPMHWGTDATNYLARLGRMGEWMYPLGRDRAANTLNLKQFRSAQDPDDYCYQALTNGPLRFTAMHRAGVLGEQNLLLGDLSGGYTIRLHRWPSLPIVETLGLEASRTHEGRGCLVSELQPVSPYWFEANMEYLRGYNVAWRSRDTVWRDRYGRRYHSNRRSPRPKPADRRFNTTLGAYNKALVGPFRYSGSTVRVLPLLAYRRTLEKLLQRYVNAALEETGFRFTLWASEPRFTLGNADGARPGRAPAPPAAQKKGGVEAGQGGPKPKPIPRTPYAYVYMTATAYGDVESSTNNVGDWASLEVAFLIPVLREEFDDKLGCWKFCGVGLLPVAIYVDDVEAVGAGAEVLGMPTIQAKFGRPPVVWLSDEPGEMKAPQQLLRLAAQVLPAFGEGQEAKMRLVIEVTEGNFLDALEEAQQPVAAVKWARTLIGEMERMDATAQDSEMAPFNRARALSLEVLNSSQPFSYLTLKQLRDIQETDTACYQSLVAVARELQEVRDIRELSQEIVVTFHETPSHPLVSTLGLVGTRTRGRGSGPAYIVQPIRPFELSLDISEELGRRLLFRSGTGKWQYDPCNGPEERRSYFCREQPICIELALPRPMELGDPSKLGDVIENAVDRKVVSIKPDRAREALGRIDPQMVIESLLAREWGSTNPKWKQYKAELEAWLAEQVVAGSRDERADQEIAALTVMADALDARAGSIKTGTPFDRLVLDTYTTVINTMAKAENEWDTIVTLVRTLDPGMIGESGLPATLTPLERNETVNKLSDRLDALQAALATVAGTGPAGVWIHGFPSDMVPRAISVQFSRLSALSAKLRHRFNRLGANQAAP